MTGRSVFLLENQHDNWPQSQMPHFPPIYVTYVRVIGSDQELKFLSWRQLAKTLMFVTTLCYSDYCYFTFPVILLTQALRRTFQTSSLATKTKIQISNSPILYRWIWDDEARWCLCIPVRVTIRGWTFIHAVLFRPCQVHIVQYVTCSSCLACNGLQAVFALAVITSGNHNEATAIRCPNGFLYSWHGGCVFLEQPAHCSPAGRGQLGRQRHHSQSSQTGAITAFAAPLLCFYLVTYTHSLC